MHMHVRMYGCTYVRMRAHTRTRTHARTHTRTHVHIPHASQLLSNRGRACKLLWSSIARARVSHAPLIFSPPAPCMSKQLPLTIDGWLQWLDAVNLQAEAFLEDNNAAHAKAILRDGLGLFRQCHPKAPSLLQPAVVRSLNNLARTYELLHNPKKALKCLEKARAFIGASSMIHHSSEVDTHANLAAVFTKLGRLSEAVEHCKIAIRLLQPLLLDDDIDTTVQARARMFLIVSYNLAVAQSRLKFYDDAIGSSGRHLKMVHAVLPSDDPIRRKLIDFRRHLAERVQQQMEEVVSEPDDPFSGTFVHLHSSVHAAAAPASATLHQLSDSQQSSDADADRESNVIFPAQHHRSGSGKADALAPRSLAPSSAPKNAWADADGRRSLSRLDDGRSRADDDASIKENAVGRSNISVQSLFDRKALTTRARSHQAMFVLQEDVPSSSTSAASSERAQKERSKSLPQQLQHDALHAHSQQSALESHHVAAAPVPPQQPPIAPEMLHMHAMESQAAVSDLQVPPAFVAPPASVLRISQTSAIVALQRFFRCAGCRHILPHARLKSARDLLSGIFLRIHLQQQLARALARGKFCICILRLHNSRALRALMSRHRGALQIGSSLLRRSLRVRLRTVANACAAVTRVYRGHRARALLDAPQPSQHIVIIQRQWRRHRSLQAVAWAARHRRCAAVSRIQLAFACLWDITAANSLLHHCSAHAQASAANKLRCSYQAFTARRQLAVFRFVRVKSAQDKLQQLACASAHRIVVACRLRFARARAGVSVVCRAWRCARSRRVFRVLVFQKIWLHATNTIAKLYRFWRSKRSYAAAAAFRLQQRQNKSSARIARAWLRRLARVYVESARKRLQASRVVCSVCRTYFFRGKAAELVRRSCANKLAAACIAVVHRRKHTSMLMPLLVLRLHTVMVARMIHRAFALVRCIRRSARARVQRREFLKVFRRRMVVRLQCAQRSRIARCCMHKLLMVMQRKKKDDKINAQLAAAAVITKSWTIHVMRVRARHELKRQRAGTIVARAWRSHCSLKCRSGHVQLLLRRVSACTLQRAFKCHFSRRFLLALVMQRCRAAAAKTVQMVWRRVVALRVVRERFHRRLQSITAVDLQCAARASAARRHLLALKRFRIQARARAFISLCVLRKSARIRSND